ncbi:hypothetical protein HJFPF1_04304 [Paramyrothecium foliicola]|nr:hypothetical protein HJFPF1_04304 [Paramyrothecium foliicola]
MSASAVVLESRSMPTGPVAAVSTANKPTKTSQIVKTANGLYELITLTYPDGTSKKYKKRFTESTQPGQDTVKSEARITYTEVAAAEPIAATSLNTDKGITAASTPLPTVKPPAVTDINSTAGNSVPAMVETPKETAHTTPGNGPQSDVSAPMRSSGFSFEKVANAMTVTTGGIVQSAEATAKLATSLVDTQIKISKMLNGEPVPLTNPPAPTTTPATVSAQATAPSSIMSLSASAPINSNGATVVANAASTPIAPADTSTPAIAVGTPLVLECLNRNVDAIAGTVNRVQASTGVATTGNNGVAAAALIPGSGLHSIGQPDLGPESSKMEQTNDHSHLSTDKNEHIPRNADVDSSPGSVKDLDDVSEYESDDSREDGGKDQEDEKEDDGDKKEDLDDVESVDTLDDIPDREDAESPEAEHEDEEENEEDVEEWQSGDEEYVSLDEEGDADIEEVEEDSAVDDVDEQEDDIEVDSEDGLDVEYGDE